MLRENYSLVGVIEIGIDQILRLKLKTHVKYEIHYGLMKALNLGTLFNVQDFLNGIFQSTNNI